MTKETKLCVAALVVMAGILAAVADKWIGSLGEAPSMSITDRHDSAQDIQRTRPRVVHQPTILRADAEARNQYRPATPPAMSPSHSGFSNYITDEETSTWHDASSADFLPIPSLDTTAPK